MARQVVGSGAVGVWSLILGLALALGTGDSVHAAPKATGDTSRRVLTEPAFHAAKTRAIKPRAPVKTRAVKARGEQGARAMRAKSAKEVRRLPHRRVAVRRGVASVRYEPPRPSVGEMRGLHRVVDELELRSAVALVVDASSDEVLYSKNAGAVLPIASLTKLMSAIVVAESGAPLEQRLEITQDDVDTEKSSRSRLRVGTPLTRGEMLHLALMSSENRAAHALGRSHPGGLDAFVAAMNRKAAELGMSATRFVEPTGLSSANRSSAHDLARLVKAASMHESIRHMSTSAERWVEVGAREVRFVTTNRLIVNPEWDIGLQKTGYISEAGRCLVMQATLHGRELILVFLDSAGKYSRLGDAERVRRWLGDSAGLAPADEDS